MQEFLVGALVGCFRSQPHSLDCFLHLFFRLGGGWLCLRGSSPLQAETLMPRPLCGFPCDGSHHLRVVGFKVVTQGAQRFVAGDLLDDMEGNTTAYGSCCQ